MTTPDKVNWIKVYTSLLDNHKIKYIRKLPDGNSIALMWVMLLLIAGRCNDEGRVYLAEGIPYTAKMLADELGFQENTIILGLQAFASLGMIVKSENGMIVISGWEKYQNVEAMDRIRKQNRERKRLQREREKLLLGNQSNSKQRDVTAGNGILSQDMSRDCHVTVTPNITPLSHHMSRSVTHTDKDKDKDIMDTGIYTQQIININKQQQLIQQLNTQQIININKQQQLIQQLNTQQIININKQQLTLPPAEPHPFETSQNLIQIQQDHEELFQAAKDANIQICQKSMDFLVGLYTEYGKDRVLKALDTYVLKQGHTLSFLKMLCADGSSSKNPQNPRKRIPPTDDELSDGRNPFEWMLTEEHDGSPGDSDFENPFKR